MYLYSTSSRSTFNVLPLCVRWRWSPQASRPARHQQTLQDHGTGWCITRYACSLPQLSSGTYSSLSQSAGSGWVGLGAWFCAKVVYSSKDSNPPRYYWSSWSSRTCYRYTRPTTHTASSRGCSTSYTTVTTIWLCSLALYTTTLFIIWLRFLSQFSKLVV